MHEAAIAGSIIKTVLDIAEREKIPQIETVNLLIGKVHHVVDDVLHNVYNIMVQDIPELKKSALKIESRDVKVHCLDCSTESVLEEVYFICGKCFSSNIEVIEGKELDILSIEGLA